MRNQVIDKIHSFMMKDSNTYFLTGDLGYNLLEPLEKDFPKRFLNAGVAEQNMLGIASGLALSENRVFIYSAIPFVTMRCFEQIRDDMCYHNLTVTILGVGSGLSYGLLGTTHFALEDISLMRSLPNMTVIVPADATEASLAIEQTFSHKGPVYFRIGKREEREVFKKPYDYKIGKGTILCKGDDIALFSTGTLLSDVLKTAKTLERRHKISSSVVNFHTLKPFDESLALNVSKGKKAIFTVEEHNVIGGLGSVIAEVLSSLKTHPPLARIGTPDTFIHRVGVQSYLRKKLGLSAKGITRKVLSTLRELS